MQISNWLYSKPFFFSSSEAAFTGTAEKSDNIVSSAAVGIITVTFDITLDFFAETLKIQKQKNLPKYILSVSHQSKKL